jgi:hypothetical protein
MDVHAIHSRKGRTRTGSILSVLCCLAAAISCSAMGCSNDSASPTTETVRLNLTFGDGVTLESVDYVLTGPHNLSRTGSLPVGDQTTITATFEDLRPGSGYEIVLQGTATDGIDTCQGDEMFAVKTGQPTTLQIPLTCTGRAAITGVVNSCPLIDDISAIPSEVRVGNAIQLTAAVRDPDEGPAPLSVTWTADGGALSNQSTTGATFTCTAAGSFTVGVSVSDGDTTGTCSSTGTGTVTVVCTAPSAARVVVAPLREGRG